MSGPHARFNGGFTTTLDPFQMQMRISGLPGFRWRLEAGEFRLQGTAEDGRTILIWRDCSGGLFRFTVQFEGRDEPEITARYFSLRSQILQRLSAELFVDETLREILDIAREGGSELDLSGRQLTDLPPEISLARSLTLLNLHGNRLAQLPAAVGDLPCLQNLYCGENQLTALPSSIGHLAELVELDASDNLLTSLPPEIGNLAKLRLLELTRNRLTELPPAIGRLRSLTSLLIEENQLQTLPPEIGNLTELTRLWLSGNQLTVLPPEMGLLKYLRTPVPPQRKNFIYTPRFMLKVDGNPLIDPPREMRDTDAIMAYLKAKLGMRIALKDKIAAAVIATGSKQITYASEWLGDLPFGVYHWVTCQSDRISDGFPNNWTQGDLAALEQQGFLRLVSDWHDPEDEFHQETTYEVRTD